MTYQKYFSSAPERPSWIDFPLADTEKNHFLVGMSEFHKTEKGARKSAMRAARNEFARYTGVEVTELDEFVMETYGASDAILNEKVSGKSTTKQAASAMVRRTKAREWYYEKLRGSCGGLDKGTAWQHWVLAVTPHDEYNAVQKWKNQKARLVQEKAEAADARRRNRTASIRLAHRKTFEDANRHLAKNDPASALIALQNDITKIDAGIVLLEKAAKEYFSDTSALQTLKEQSYSLIHTIASSLIVDTGRNATVFLPAEKKGFVNVKAWVYFKYQEGAAQPVSGFRLSLIKEGSDKQSSLAQTDATGRAVFRPDTLLEGSYKVRIDTAKGSLTNLNPAIKKVLTAAEGSVLVQVYTPDPEGAVKSAIQQLFSGPSRKPAPATSVLMGEVRYEDSRLGSAFGRRLNRIIKKELVTLGAVRIIEPQRTRSVQNLKRIARTRGISMDKRPLPMSSSAMQAQLGNAEATLDTRYFIEGDSVKIDLKLIQAKTGQILSYATAAIDKNFIPLELDFLPPNADQTFTPVYQGKSKINLELTTHRGDGVTFAKGEKVTFYVSTDRDAYLLILYKDAGNNLIQVYPNSLSGNGFHPAEEFMAIPDDTSPFDFTISPPFGVEEVWAFAATEPFPELAGSGLANGLKLVQGDFNPVIQTLRKKGRSGKGYGEANVVITTVRE